LGATVLKANGLGVRIGGVPIVDSVDFEAARAVKSSP
jgi:hypothetical protein